MLKSIVRKTISLETRIKLHEKKNRLTAELGKLRHLKLKLRRLAKGRQILGQMRGFEGKALVGWVIDADNRGSLAVGLYLNGTLLAKQTADILYNDVALAGFGDGRCGYRFDINDDIFERVRQSAGSALEIRLQQGAQDVLGKIDVPSQIVGELSAQAQKITQLRGALTADLQHLTELLANAPQWIADRAKSSAPNLSHHHKLFSQDLLIPDDRGDHQEPTGLSAYTNYVFYRSRLNETLTPRLGNADWEKALHHYILNHGFNEKLRIPLSAQEIAFLNAPLVMPYLEFDFSRAHWWRLGAMSGGLKAIKNAKIDQLIYKWSMHEAPSRRWEDCLVPERYIQRMQHLEPMALLQNFGLNQFTRLICKEDKALRKLNPALVEERRLIYLVILLRAIQRPDLLRYLPQKIVDDLLQPKDGQASDFQTFLQVLDIHSPVPVDRATYGALLEQKAFDLEAGQFKTLTQEGDRLSSAALPVPAGEATVDLQMIGPFKKSSGLGQAARLSQRIAEKTGYSVNAVDFSMENPTPEGFSSTIKTSTYQKAKINILQLNAEVAPLPFAYQPDVFSDAYNIAYVYWELDSPALCHYLGMDLIDEIWVAADYGVQIYQPFTDKPVTNVGMCFEELGEINRAESRDFICQTFNFTGDEFIFFIAFDSYSFAQRKNPLSVLHAFSAAFPDQPDVRLVIKTQNRHRVSDPVQAALWAQIDRYLAQDKRIVLLNETLNYREVLRLKAGSDCYVSLHRSEGWGFGMIEAMNLKVPVICTGYSANLDFCPPEAAWLVDYDEIEVGKGDYIFVRKGQLWAEPRIDHAAKQMRALYDNPALRAQKVEFAYKNVQENFSAQAISQRFKKRIDEIMAKIET